MGRVGKPFCFIFKIKSSIDPEKGVTTALGMDCKLVWGLLLSVGVTEVFLEVPWYVVLPGHKMDPVLKL